MADDVKISRFRRALAGAEFDVVVAMSPENCWYLSEVVIDTQRYIPERLGLVAWPRVGEPVYIVATNEEVQARRETWIADLRAYVEYKECPMEFLSEVIREHGADHGVIGIEKHFLTMHYSDKLKRLLPHVTLKEVAPLFDGVRAIKTPEEIRRLEDAAQATDRAMRTALGSARPGITEKDVGVLMARELILGGAEMPGFQVLAAGVNTCSTHQRAGDYILQAGDLMRADTGGVFPKGYYSDLARTICVGTPSQRQVHIYQTIWEEHERLIAMLRPGVTCREVFLSHKHRWEQQGWPMVRPHIGHSLGIALHESPVFMPSQDTPLEPGMCVCLEPNHLIPNVEKYHVEDLMEITARGCRVLSRSADWSGLTPTA